MKQTSTIHFSIISLFRFFVVSLGVGQLISQRALCIFSLFFFSLDIFDVLCNFLLLNLRSAWLGLEMEYLYAKAVALTQFVTHCFICFACRGDKLLKLSIDFQSKVRTLLHFDVEFCDRRENTRLCILRIP
jgi:hypothetical protein